MFCTVIQPRLHAPGTYLRGSQHESQTNRLILAGMLVARANLLTLQIIQQWNIGRCRKRSLEKFDWRAHIHQGQVLQEKVPVGASIFAHYIGLDPMSYFPAAVNFRISLEVFRDSRTADINHVAGLLDRGGELETTSVGRSEERRVGKECRSRGSARH